MSDRLIRLQLRGNAVDWIETIIKHTGQTPTQLVSTLLFEAAKKLEDDNNDK